MGIGVILLVVYAVGAAFSFLSSVGAAIFVYVRALSEWKEEHSEWERCEVIYRDNHTAEIVEEPVFPGLDLYEWKNLFLYVIAVSAMSWLGAALVWSIFYFVVIDTGKAFKEYDDTL